MYWGHFETKNFSFDSFGKTKLECYSSLIKGLLEHGKQYNLDIDSIKYIIKCAKDEFYPLKLTIPSCIRENEVLL